MAETTPGPLIMVLQFVGFMAAFRNPGGLPPMLAATLGADFIEIDIRTTQDGKFVLVHDGKAVGVVFARSSHHGDRAWATDIRAATTLLAADDDVAADTGACANDPH